MLARKRYSKGTKLKATKMLKDGASVTDVAAKLKMSKATVYKLNADLKSSANSAMNDMHPIAVRKASTSHKNASAKAIEKEIASRKKEISILERTLEILTK